MINFNEMSKKELVDWIDNSVYCVDIFKLAKIIQIHIIKIDYFVLREDGKISPAVDNLYDDYGNSWFFESKKECLEYCRQDKYFDYKINIYT